MGAKPVARPKHIGKHRGSRDVEIGPGWAQTQRVTCCMDDSLLTTIIRLGVKTKLSKSELVAMFCERGMLASGIILEKHLKHVEVWNAVEAFMGELRGRLAAKKVEVGTVE